MLMKQVLYLCVRAIHLASSAVCVCVCERVPHTPRWKGWWCLFQVAAATAATSFTFFNLIYKKMKEQELRLKINAIVILSPPHFFSPSFFKHFFFFFLNKYFIYFYVAAAKIDGFVLSSINTYSPILR